MKSHAQPMLAYHLRSFVVGILLIGGMVSFAILYVAMSPATPLESILPEGGVNISASDTAFNRIVSWVERKQADGARVPRVPNAAFFTQRSL